ncbi:MAG: hypothetical protein HGJ93_04815 [Desulfosarcina sp.]|nr:hypothetical protein [Desulfosarcina sp.]MBC2765286.1 hypothetical protein [Desulfosarcina sp.]
MDEYLHALTAFPEHRRRCQLLMAVSISRFMRDLSLWLELQQTFLPELADLFPETLNVWSAGCACGEEVYSFKMIWHLFMQKHADAPKLKVLATDINPENLEKAVAGVYPLSSLKEVPEHMRREYFTPLKGGRRYRVRAMLKEEILWEQRHLLEALPQKKFHIIFLRNNLLTYYRSELKEKAMGAIAGLLACRGLLIIGVRENMGFQKQGLVPTGHPNVYRRVHGVCGQG